MGHLMCLFSQWLSITCCAMEYGIKIPNYLLWIEKWSLQTLATHQYRVCVFVYSWAKIGGNYIVNTMAKIFNELLFFGISHVYCFFFSCKKREEQKRMPKPLTQNVNYFYDVCGLYNLRHLVVYLLTLNPNSAHGRSQSSSQYFCV